jgi:hypothetical protein
MMSEGGGVDEDNTKSYRAMVIFSLPKDKLRWLQAHMSSSISLVFYLN